MSRTKHGSKAPGYDYWGKRPKKAGTSPGKGVKQLTHRLERRIADRALAKEIS